MSLQDEMRRGQLAQDVLNNEVYAEAYALIEQEITRAWRESKDKDEREELHRALRSLVKVKTLMEGTMQSGQIAADKLRIEQSRLQRIGSGFKTAFAR
jgi:hypothetical protein